MCAVWGADSYKIMETLHLKFLKHILYVKPSTCNNMVYGELEIYPDEIIVQKRMLAYWGRSVSGKETKLGKIMYNVSYLYTIHVKMD